MRRPCFGSFRRKRSASKPWRRCKTARIRTVARCRSFRRKCPRHEARDALYAKRADYDGGAVVIVATIQAFRVEETEGRKVYEANGELMDHFTGLAEGLRAALGNWAVRRSGSVLANVLRLRRPMVIVDEAHNARTEFSFDTLGAAQSRR